MRLKKIKVISLIAVSFLLGVGLAFAIIFCAGKDNTNITAKAGVSDAAAESTANSVKIAMISFNPELHEKEKNIRRLSDYVESACKSGAKIIVAPEMVTDDYFTGKDGVINYSGVKDLEAEFSQICAIVDKYDAYVCFGYPEITVDGHLYNSASIIGADGKESLKTRKLAIPDWNEAGNLEPAVCKTEYGNIGIVICADAWTASYVTDICALGADIILSPVTWYGDAGQFETWTARASENNIWYIACNRWGVEWAEFDNANVDMSDAPCAVIDPDGNVVLSYTEGNTERDCIVFYEIPIDDNN